MYAESKLAILPIPLLWRGAQRAGWLLHWRGAQGAGSPQNENEIENEYVHDIRHCQNRGLKI
jgi:hypothetical protein